MLPRLGMRYRLINHQTQSHPDGCMSASIAMVAGMDVREITDKYHDRVCYQKMTKKEVLDELGVVNTAPVIDMNTLYPGNVYILTVASLNYIGGLHCIVADFSGDELVILDPNNGYEGRNYYVRDVSDVYGEYRLTSWTIDNIIPTKLPEPTDG